MGRELVFTNDPLNERVVLAAAIVGAEFRKDTVRLPPDTFLSPEHAAIWRALKEASRLGIEPTPTTLVRLGGTEVDVRYVEELVGQHPDLPGAETLNFAVEQLKWDRQKHVALTGPIDGLLNAIGSNEAPERVRGLARQVSATFDGWGDRRYLHDPAQLVAEQMGDLRERMSGRAIYPYGIPGLDRDERGISRIVPAAAPGQITVITGVPGMGKSTLTARIVLGILRQKRKVLYGSWEMTSATALELMACQSLAETDPTGDWSRTKLRLPTDHPGWLGEDRMARFERQMMALSRNLRFLKNPFRRQAGGKASNERNLDMVAGYIADSGCDVFVADLWKRCLVKAAPEDEEEALYRQQAMAEELGVHCILVQQQRSKDVEARADKRPTREGIKGSGAWTEVADTILGVHRQGQWKPVPDDVLEIDVLKQRYGKWPIAVEFRWDPDTARISGGTTVEYDVASARSESDNPIDRAMVTPKTRKNETRNER